MKSGFACVTVCAASLLILGGGLLLLAASMDGQDIGSALSSIAWGWALLLLGLILERVTCLVTAREATPPPEKPDAPPTPPPAPSYTYPRFR